MSSPQTFADIIKLWPRPADLAADLDPPVQEVTVRQWRLREMIPAEYWKQIEAAAERRGILGVTMDVLAEITARTAGRYPEPEEARAVS